VGGRHPIWSFSLQQHAQDASLIGEVVGVGAAERDTERRVDIADGKPESSRFDAIDEYAKLRRIRLAFGTHLREDTALTRGGEQLIPRSKKRLRSFARTVLQLECESARYTKTGDRGWIEGVDERLLDLRHGSHCPVDERGCAVLLPRTLIPRTQRDERHRVRLPLTEKAEALHDVHALYLGLCGIESFDLLDRFARTLRRRARRCLDHNKDHTLILSRQEAAGQPEEQHQSTYDKHQVDGDKAQRPHENATDAGLIASGGSREPTVESVEHASGDPQLARRTRIARRVRLQQGRA